MTTKPSISKLKTTSVVSVYTTLLFFLSPASATPSAPSEQCATPNYIEQIVNADQAPGVTPADLEVLKGLLAKNDRAGMYLVLYRLTGDEFWLMDAQITSFSGVWGGTALEANYQIKLRNKDKYQESLDKFSLKIATNMLKWVEKSVLEGNKGYVDTSVLLMNGDGDIWKSKGLYNEYPGRVLFFNLNQYSAKDLGYIFGLGSIYSAQAALEQGARLGKRPADFAKNPNFSQYTSTDGRFITVIDNRTCKVEVFFDKEARPMGVLKQIPNVALTTKDVDFYDRMWRWEFMQGNQDTAEEYKSSVWLDNKPVPSPYIKGSFYKNISNGSWYYRSDNTKVEKEYVISSLEYYLRTTMETRKALRLPEEPQIPKRYQGSVRPSTPTAPTN